MLHFPSSSHPSPHAVVVVLSKKLMNAKLFWLRWRGCSIEQMLASIPLPLAYFFGLKIIGYSMTTSLFLNLWSHYVLIHSTFAVEWHVCKPISNLLSSIPNTLHKSSWIGPKKLEPLHGLLHYQSLSMDLFSTKEHFMMQSAYTTDGDLLYYHHSVFVAGISQQNMHWAVTMMVDSLLYTTMK